MVTFRHFGICENQKKNKINVCKSNPCEQRAQTTLKTETSKLQLQLVALSSYNK